MILYIDTTEKGKIRFALRKQDELIAEFEKITDQMSEEILLELIKFLKKNKLSIKDLDKVEINNGPGPFSQVRTGVAVGNALNFALGNKTIISPKYDKEPNITKSKNIWKQ